MRKCSSVTELTRLPKQPQDIGFEMWLSPNAIDASKNIALSEEAMSKLLPRKKPKPITNSMMEKIKINVLPKETLSENSLAKNLEASVGDSSFKTALPTKTAPRTILESTTAVLLNLLINLTHFSWLSVRAITLLRRLEGRLGEVIPVW
jgi:hypothetical protein